MFTSKHEIHYGFAAKVYEPQRGTRSTKDFANQFVPFVQKGFPAFTDRSSLVFIKTTTERQAGFGDRAELWSIDEPTSTAGPTLK